MPASPDASAPDASAPDDSAYAEARARIADRLAAATQAGDARRADAYAACFTEMGALQLDETIAPREAIRAWMAGASIIPQPGANAPAQNPGFANPGFANPGFANPGFVSHHLTTMQITLTGATTARARTYWFVITAIGPDHSGYYDDRLEKHGADWLIAHRRPRTLWYSPQSLVRPVTA